MNFQADGIFSGCRTAESTYKIRHRGDSMRNNVMSIHLRSITNAGPVEY